MGVVDRVVPDPDQDGFIQITVKPAARLDRLDEVLVITSTQPRFPDDQKQDMAESETLKGAEAAQLNAQRKASEILAEKLPGLTDPNLPADQQPLNDTSNPNPVARPPMALHPDRFTPGVADQTGLPTQSTNPTTSGAAPESKPAAAPQSTAPAKPDAQQQREP